MKSPIRVFLAEDSRFDVRAFLRQLRGWDREYEIEIATNGKAACEFVEDVEETRPDVAVVDLNMPRVSGIEVLRRIRHSDHLADLPCIVLTTSESSLDKSECEALKVGEYLLKTARAHEVIGAIERQVAGMR